ncbi:MAG: hypothetical protein LAO77_25720 [Acidobacteriia bacterium]|nr:hypothetical protein [Terriglobia bacterium]
MIALDTNVLIYACDKADPVRQQIALDLISNTADARAKTLHLDHKVSFWDATILAACVDTGASLLYSEDIPGGDIAGVPVVNPFK